MTLDHIVVAGPDLAATVAWFTDLTGVAPVPGGRHDGIGTANHLVGLTVDGPGGPAGTGAYLELIGPDPEQPPPRQPRPFGIDRLDAVRVVTWAARCDDLDARVAAARARGYDPGAPLSLSRRAPDGQVLRWRLTPPDAPVGDGVVPFLIDWTDTAHPTTRGLPAVALVSFEATHPDPARVRSALTALGVDLPVLAGDRAAVSVVLDGRSGRVALR